jgi:hypothetical protein
MPKGPDGEPLKPPAFFSKFSRHSSKQDSASQVAIPAGFFSPLSAADGKHSQPKVGFGRSIMTPKGSNYRYGSIGSGVLT